MPKTTKTKEISEKTLKKAAELNVVLKTIDNMQDNMDILNKNIQHAIDQVEEIQIIVKKMRDRMGI
jgi:alpha-D-ribose 1-methylphosphonate 5-triphosphate synthase subunit PhnI|tara:strand:+ start:71 stop:268 length:198 start_codon:yes stop_codon:yes gene_type:complete